MKKRYVKPEIEPFAYMPEQGYASTVAQNKDYVLIKGDDHSTLRSSEEVTEWTDETGEWTVGEWLLD